MVRNKPFIILGCLIAILVSLVSLLKTSCSRGPHYNPTVDRCLGETMAQETGKLLGGQGDIIVFSLDAGEFQNEASGAQMKGFRDGLRKHGGIEIRAIEGPTTPEAFGRMMALEGVPEDIFMDAVARHPQAKAIVSFLGVPRFQPTGAPIDPKRLPRVIALDNAPRANWRDLLESGVVSIVICPQTSADTPQSAAKGDCAARLHAQYRVVTKADLKEAKDKS